MKKATILFAMVLFSAAGYSQVNSGLLTTLSAIAGMRDRFPIEKLYLQLDKPYYSLGDTLRFKAYLLNADFLKPSKRSGLLYVELANNSNKIVKRITIRLALGIGWADIALRGKNIPEGAYTLRAYTNWMENFGDDYIYKKSFYISSVNGSSTLVKANFKLENGIGKDKVTANLSFTGLNDKPKQQKDIRLTIKQADKTLFKEQANTGAEGNVQLNFDVPEKSAIKNVNIHAQDMSTGADTTALIIPININRVENTDLQFMPEGGNLVAGLTARIGFKAINGDGKGIAISGKIIDSKQKEVATFKSTHTGMGVFELTPQAGESYTAAAILSNGTIKIYALPKVNTTGTALSVNSKSKDALELTIAATPDLLTAATTYYLVGQTRGVVCYSSVINFKGAEVKKIITTDLFPTGIAHFTLFTSYNRPLNERIFYIDHQDNLQIAVNTDKPNYNLRDSIGLTIQTNGKDGKPIRGNFSVAVTDDSQINTDSLTDNIVSNMLLASDLKGTVEEPGYYFNEKNADRAAALDNLLLTQGWVGYDWKQVFAPTQKPQYDAETDFIVKGHASNIFNKPVANTEVMLISTKPTILLNTKTDKDGMFTFKDFPRLDTINFRIQTKRTLNIGVNVDVFAPAEITATKNMPLPWYVNSDSIMVNYAKKKKIEWDESYDARNTILLKEVEIKAKQPEPLYLNRLLIQMDEEEIRNARPGKKPLTLHQLLNQQEDLSQMHLRLIVDGQRTTHLQFTHTTQPGVKYDIMDEPPPEKVPDESPEVLGLLDHLMTEDIKGFSAKKILVPVLIVIPFTDPPIKIERMLTYLQVSVTTNIKFGDDAIPPGDFVYRPMPISWPRQFYSPRYTVNSTPIGKDRRSTIFWVPNLVTDASGKADLSFYSADLRGSYTVIIEGTDMNGNLGFNRKKIKIGSGSGSTPAK
ncbi:hypothetical protein [Mucilaginibacter sp.]|uniref:hypothetical protein n=1 Tax=Mucilaginibacter sp. TaxID=1882438 RepID=UPI002636554F|nr:hypothetical protein [Mucilaginibacter sp.]MDB5030620.1 hypothetical protein [Mucilaginibacter sp.]